MLSIDAKNNITLTRGDTLTLTLTLTQDGETYEVQSGDTIRFAVSKGYLTDSAYELLISEDFDTSGDDITVTVDADDTALSYGSYNYDVEITHSDGSVDTVISAKLIITGEVE